MCVCVCVYCRFYSSMKFGEERESKFRPVDLFYRRINLDIKLLVCYLYLVAIMSELLRTLEK